MTSLLELDGKWQLAFCADTQYRTFAKVPTRWEEISAFGLTTVPATVPGNVEPDLVAAGIMTDPLVGDGIRQTFAMEGNHYWYYRTFSYEGDCKGCILLLEGMDTYGTVYLNGVCIGTGDNMLIPQQMEASSLRSGENEILIHIRPTVLESRKENHTVMESMLDYGYDGLWVRKAPYMFGWDIMPRLISAGLWRSVSIVRKKECGFIQHYLYTREIRDNRAEMTLFYELELQDLLYGNLSVRVTLSDGEKVCRQTHGNVWGKAGNIRFAVDHPRLWWPRGYGEAFLYDVTVELLCGDTVLDSEHFAAGIRTAQLTYRPHTEDKEGAFDLHINGKHIFVLGTNWVPLHVYPSLQEARIKKALELVTDVGCNTIRCWGGNVYESETFYEECDRLGLLVWQDFALACGSYPQDERLLKALEKEFRHVVREKRQHPCICLWAGDNECDVSYMRLGSPEDNRISREVLPRVLMQEDPIRSYLPSSPYMDPISCAQGMDSSVEQHLWGDRLYFDCPYYTDTPALFASEIGYHGCPSPDSIDKFITPDHRFPCEGDEQWLLHCSSPETEEGQFTYRIGLMGTQVRNLTGEQPEDLERFALFSQISQAEAMKRFVEMFRTAQPRKSGIIWWNILDGCPQISDAVVDFYFTKKLAYHYIRTSQQPVLMAVRRTENGFSLFGVNDTDSEMTLNYTVDDAGSKAKLCCGCVTLPPRGLVKMDALPATNATLVSIQWNASNVGKGRNHAYIGTYPMDIRRYIREADAMGLLKIEGFSTGNPIEKVLNE